MGLKAPADGLSETQLTGVVTLDEIPFLICMRVANLPDPNPGASQVPCSRCFWGVWVSPASPYWSRPVQVICLDCAPAHVDRYAEELPYTEEQRLEISRATGLEGDQIDRFLKSVIIPRIFGLGDPE